MNSRKQRPKKVITKSGKVVLQVTLPLDLYERLVELAPRVYGVSRGALSMAVQEALEYWLELRSAHTAHTRLNPRPDHRHLYNCVIDCIHDELDFLPLSVPQHIMAGCIMKCRRVVDERTVWKWLHTFYANGWIKPLTIEKPRSWRDWARNRAVEIVARRA